jgi:NAD(P)H-hydrate epimerase
MIKILSGQQMKQMDQKAIEQLGIPGILLMENAGRAVYEEVMEHLNNDSEIPRSVVVICGKGNNGGDGFVAARHLVENGVQTSVISLYRPENLTGAALLNHNILENFLQIIYFDEIDLKKLKEIIIYSDIVVDAVFGTGLSAEVKGITAEIINTINEYSEGNVISVDIPSGVNADTGEIMGCAVFADYTVTFHCPKLGMFLYPGARHCGEIIIDPIGIPDSLNEDKEYNVHLITEHYINISLPFRPEDSNKSTFGKVFSVAGSFSMSGAAYMCAMSCLLAGAGYSLLATPKSAVHIIASKTAEVVYVPLEETLEGTISEKAILNALDKSFESNVILIGPGLSTNDSTVKFVYQFLQQITNRGDKVILDADALNAIALQEQPIFPVNSLITPHPKELSRLMKVSVEEILKDRIKFARESSLKLNTIIVLKGANTIIAEPNGNVYINTTGNSGLATPGSGDVLAGLIAGFAAQGVELKNAAILGVYIQGLASEIAVNKLTEYSLTASSLMHYIPEAIKCSIFK